MNAPSSGLSTTARRVVRRVRRSAPGAAARTEAEKLRRRLERMRAEAERQQRKADKERARLESRLEKAEARTAEERRRIMKMGYAYRGLHAAATGIEVKALGAPKGRPLTDDERRGPEAEARLNQHYSTLAAALADGRSLPAAMGAMVRNGFGSDRIVATRRVAQQLQQQGRDLGGDNPIAHAGALGVGLLAKKLGLDAFAWENLSTLPERIWVPEAAGEYLELVGRLAPERVGEVIESVLEHDAPLAAEHWIALVRIAMGLEATAHLAELQARFVATAAGEPERWADELAWLEVWVPRILAAQDGGAPRPQLADGEVAIGVMTYQQPDLSRTSTNIGDFVQTIGSMSHLVRHTGARFDDSPLGRFAGRLAERVPAQLRVDDEQSTQVRLFAVDRDASHLAEIPDGTWMLGFGWYAHTIGGVRHDFPFDERIRPIFVSFHVNRHTLLSDEAIEYLRRHAPIGCRDWSTVDLLLSLDIPAFFSGCLTTTVRYVQPDDQERPADDAPVFYVDVEPPAERPDGRRAGARVRNERPEVALQSAEQNLWEALDILDEYATGAHSLVTKRLHCYLPARALGRPVDFVPRNLADTRFNGLSPLSDDEVHAMGRSIADLLEPSFSLILGGADEATVREAWATSTAGLVEQARRRRDREVELPAAFDLEAAVRTVHEGRVRVPARTPGASGDPIDVVLALDGNLKEEFLAVVAGLVEHASRPVRLHVLCRDHDQADYDRAAGLFGDVEFDWLPCDDIDYGDIRSMLTHITISTMDRLLLPSLLPDVARVLYHDIDALPIADVVPLFEIDLQGRPLAARDSEASAYASGFTNVYFPARALTDRPEQAFELIRREFARHAYDYTGFNAGVLVLDLERMRADRFCERFLPYASEFGMHDQHVLNCYVGADRVVLEPEWNSRPSQERVEDVRIVHWAGGQKPWEPGYVPFVEHWRAAEAALAARSGAGSATTSEHPAS